MSPDKTKNERNFSRCYRYLPYLFLQLDTAFSLSLSMATSTGKTQCVRCAKDKCTYKCAGCSKDFCMNHLKDHQKDLEKQFDEIELNRKTFQESLAEQRNKLQDNPLLKQIDAWERDSIKGVRETAEAAKLLLTQQINGHYIEIEIKLNKLTNQLNEIREENDFNEINLRRFHDDFTRLSTESVKVPIMTFSQDSSSCMNNIHGKVSGKCVNSSSIERRISSFVLQVLFG